MPSPQYKRLLRRLRHMDPMAVALFEANLIAQNGPSTQHHFMSVHDRPNIDDAFTWGKTPEGHDYWSRLHEQEQWELPGFIGNKHPNDIDGEEVS